MSKSHKKLSIRSGWEQIQFYILWWRFVESHPRTHKLKRWRETLAIILIRFHIFSCMKNMMFTWLRRTFFHSKRWASKFTRRSQTLKYSIQRWSYETFHPSALYSPEKLVRVSQVFLLFCRVTIDNRKIAREAGKEFNSRQVGNTGIWD